MAKRPLRSDALCKISLDYIIFYKKFVQSAPSQKEKHIAITNTVNKFEDSKHWIIFLRYINLKLC